MNGLRVGAVFGRSRTTRKRHKDIEHVNGTRTTAPLNKQFKRVQHVNSKTSTTVKLLSKNKGRPVHRPVGVFNPAALREELQVPF